MPYKALKALLTDAKAVIADPDKWTQYAMARGASGETADARGAEAVCWCGYGIVRKLSGSDESMFCLAINYLDRTTAKLVGRPSRYPDVNDGVFRIGAMTPHQAAVHAFEEAINGLGDA